MKENNREYLGRLMSDDRISAGVSQRHVAEAMGISYRTVQHWESGESTPDLEQMIEYYKAISVNPRNTIFAFMYPHLKGMTRVDKNSDQAAMFQRIFSNLSMAEIDALNFIASSYHGGGWIPLLQLILAYLNTPLADRFKVARSIVENYEFAMAQGAIQYPDFIQPDMEILDTAIQQGRSAAMHNKKGYL